MVIQETQAGVVNLGRAESEFVSQGVNGGEEAQMGKPNHLRSCSQLWTYAAAGEGNPAAAGQFAERKDSDTNRAGKDIRDCENPQPAHQKKGVLRARGSEAGRLHGGENNSSTLESGETTQDTKHNKTVTGAVVERSAGREVNPNLHVCALARRTRPSKPDAQPKNQAEGALLLRNESGESAGIR